MGKGVAGGVVALIPRKKGEMMISQHIVQS